MARTINRTKLLLSLSGVPLALCLLNAPARAATETPALLAVESTPVSKAVLPPFPFVDYPSTLPADFRNTKLVLDFDQIYVLAGQDLHPIEGRISLRSFPNDPAKLSPTAVRNSYTNAIKTLGGVKVNAVQPTDPAWVRRQGGDMKSLFDKMRLIHSNSGSDRGIAAYDAYLIRTPQSNIWITVAVFDGGMNTQIIVTEEKALEKTIGFISADKSPATARQASQGVKGLAFPYLDYPSTVPKNFRNDAALMDFDQAVIIKGRQMHAVEGRLSIRRFPNNPARLSPLAVRRSYAEAVKMLGGVKFNEVEPTDTEWQRLQGGTAKDLFGKLRLLDGGRGNDGGIAGYDVYRIETAVSKIWIAVSLYDGGINTQVMTIEEKAQDAVVDMVKADKMASSLEQQGHVALYLTFDTDSDVIRPESQPVIDEVVKLLQAQPTLRLTVEGHTDNSGDKARNQALSLARAKSVINAIAARKIDATRLSATGFGASKPVGDNNSEQGRAKNRRVVLTRR